MKQFIFVLLFFSFGCKNSKKSFNYKFEKPKTKSIIGNFDGDKTQDTLREIVYSDKSQLQIDKVLTCKEYEFDTVVNWYFKNSIRHKLALSNHTSEMYFSYSMGFYFLKNIGDINNDGKDEVALAIDLLDYSRVNSCIIYTLCNNDWKEIKRFTIHEGAFDYYGNEEPIFDEIKEYLENSNGIWHYHDYIEDAYENVEDVGKMKVLSLEKCN